MKYQFIAKHATQHRLATLCRVLDVSRSGYYAWRQGPSSAREQANAQLAQQIARVHHESEECYGSPRIFKALSQRGVPCSRNRVARLMRLKHLQAKTKRRFRVTTRACKDACVVPDLVQRRFEAPAPNRIWTSDITYIWTREGWVYLAVILDLYSRRIVGWELHDRLSAEVVSAALKQAIDRRQPDRDLILHSDRGTQYASHQVRRLAQEHGIRLSMGATGSCYDNAVTESFFHTLKTERIYFERYNTRQEARQSIFQYIEVFYNRQRLHSTIGNISPDEHEKRFNANQKNLLTHCPKN